MGGIKGECKKNMIKIPKGCFSVYVGSERQRFIVKTKFVTHPLFKMLLDEAEEEFGFQNDGPIRLPCNVDLFYKVLAEMNNFDEEVNKINDGIFISFNKAKRFSLFGSSKPKLYE